MPASLVIVTLMAFGTDHLSVMFPPQLPDEGVEVKVALGEQTAGSPSTCTVTCLVTTAQPGPAVASRV